MAEKLMAALLGAIAGGFFAMTAGLMLLCAILWQKGDAVGEAHSWWLVPLGMILGGVCGWKSAGSSNG